MSSTPARIHRLRLSGGASAPSVVSSVREWLQANPPERHGLPPDAIVLLRHLRAPLSALRHERGQGPMHDALRQARRPAHDALVGAACGAVWFADEAELLGCLASDTVRGELSHAWWWRTLLGTAPDAGHALQRWLQHARAAPRAMAQLPPHQAMAWAQVMGPAGRRELCLSLAQAHPLPAGWVVWLAQRCADPSAPSGAWASQGHAPASSGQQDPDGAPTETQGAPRPSRGPGALGESDQEPVDGPALLIGLCHLLHQAPHRSADGDALARLVRQAQVGLVTSPPRWATPSSDRGHRATAFAPSLEAAPPSLAAPPTAAGVRTAPGRPGGAPAAGRHAREAFPADGSGSATSGLRLTGDALPLAQQDTGLPEHPHRPAQGSSAALAPTSAKTLTRHPALSGIDTQATAFDTPFGGLFFLLNVALAWELYGDFTRPRQAGLSVSPWQFLHAAGVALLGRAFRADPLAAWLRSRAPFQRPQRLATDWQPPRELPADLFASMQGRPLTPGRHANELSIWWPLLRQRLALALNLPADQDPVRMTLCLSARVRCRAERVDVHLSLAHLPLAVRLAGLDRDPGWVPAAGSDLRFHFDGPTP